jgi:predicted dinucleotide-binding enzyme
MKIGIIGTGRVGSALGRGLSKHNHNLMYGAREPKSQAVKDLCNVTNVTAGRVSDAVAFADIVIIALPGDVALAVIDSVDDWQSKVIIDATNPFLSGDDSHRSFSTIIAKKTGAPVAKAFNSIGSAVMENPVFDKDKALHLVCGDDTAKLAAIELSNQLGFDTRDVGGLEQEELLAAMVQVWVALGPFSDGSWDYAFKYLQR